VNFESNADGKLEKIEGQYMISEITLMPTLIIHHEDDKEKAIRILQKSEAACLISHSIKAHIIFKPTIKVV
jgi:organic hydroperoxide reductase OsmC/OhrA